MIDMSDSKGAEANLNTNNSDSKKQSNGKYYYRGQLQVDFEKLILKALERAEVPLSKLFIDRVDKKPYLRKLTVRTKEGKHFRMVIGKDELLNSYEMFVVLLKAKYKEALKQPDKPKQPQTNAPRKIDNDRKQQRGWKGTFRKPKDKSRMGRTTKVPSSTRQEGKPALVGGKV
jgi:hypothetical protein